MTEKSEPDKSGEHREDENLRRMLNTPPKPHKEMKRKGSKKQGGARQQPKDTS